MIAWGRLAIATCLFAMAAAPLLAQPELLATNDQLDAIETGFEQGSDPFDALTKRLQSDIADEIVKGPWSVTDHPSRAESGDPHDYYSEGPYWWPDPDDPDGPYIRRDGEVNPERFDEHGRAWNRMIEAVFTLAQGAAWLDDEAAGERAALLLRVWFIDPETRMNPHLNYAQAIFGRTKGRGIGIIDTRHIVELTQALAILKRSGAWPEDEQRAVDAWLAQYLEWLTTSKNGLDEKHEHNNHATWWAAQVAALAVYLGDDDTAAMAFERCKEHLIPTQIKPDGSQPYEERRTRSLNYSVMNLNGFSILARMAQLNGGGLWPFESDEGSSLAGATTYLMPYLSNPDPWTHTMLKPYEPVRQPLQLFAALGLERDEWLDAWHSLPPRYDAFGLFLDALAAVGD